MLQKPARVHMNQAVSNAWGSGELPWGCCCPAGAVSTPWLAWRDDHVAVGAHVWAARGECMEGVGRQLAGLHFAAGGATIMQWIFVVCGCVVPL